MPSFLRVGDFALRLDGSTVKATNNAASYGTVLNAEQEKTVGQYVTGMSAGEVSFSARETDANKLNVTFSGVHEGLMLDVLSIELEIISKVNPLDWIFELISVTSGLNAEAQVTKKAIEEQETQIEQMIAAKNKFQEEMLERVCAILEARHHGHATILDMIQPNREEQPMPAENSRAPLIDIKPELGDQVSNVDIKLEPTDDSEDESGKPPSMPAFTSNSETETTADETE